MKKSALRARPAPTTVEPVAQAPYGENQLAFERLVKIRDGLQWRLAAAGGTSEIDLTLQESESRELQRVEAAIERIRSGTYEQCERCGMPIGVQRLKALPSSDMCVKCKQVVEAEEQGEEGDLDLGRLRDGEEE